LLLDVAGGIRGTNLVMAGSVATRLPQARGQARVEQLFEPAPSGWTMRGNGTWR
jgi:hypothetical protein